MNRVKINLWVDILAFVGVVLLAVTGFILEFVLPPGSGRLEGGGMGRGALQRPITLLWGLTRHEWGEIHYWTALAVAAILCIHLILHWRWIVCMVRRQPSENCGIRWGLGILALATLLAFIMAPFISKTTQVPRGELLQQRSLDD